MLANISVANDACGYDAKIAAQSETVQLLGDRTLVSNSRLLGAQDTVFAAGSGTRQYLRNTFVNGSCDAIYGVSAMIFDNCTIAITDHVTADRGGDAAPGVRASCATLHPPHLARICI